MFGSGALLVGLTTLGCDFSAGGRMTFTASEEQQACIRALELPGSTRLEQENPEYISYHWTPPSPTPGPSIGTSVASGRVRIDWGWINAHPRYRDVQELLVHVRVLRDLMVSQCGVDPSTIECDAKENVGHLCP